MVDFKQSTHYKHWFFPTLDKYHKKIIKTEKDLI
jgi:hypothetical protein